MTEAFAASLTVQDRSLLEALPCYVFLQKGGDLTYANQLAREALGIEAETVFAVEDVFEGAFPGLAYGRSGKVEPRSKNVLGSANQPYTTEFECRLRSHGGSSVPVHGRLRVLQAEPEMHLLIAAMPASGGAASGESAHFLEQLLNAAPEAIMITRGARILHVNREFEKLFGFTADEAVGRNTFDLLIPETRRHEFGMLEHTMQLYGRASMETVRLHKSGELIDVSVLVAPIELSGVTVGNFVSYRDITEKRQTVAKLQHDALHDSLTGLANRTLFLDRLQLTMARQQRRSGLNFAVIFLDLDRFKAVNDTLGHASGDDLLIKIATRLRACFRPEDTVARFGGDEFAILIEEVSDTSAVAGIASRVQQEVRLPVEIHGNEIVVSASMGIAFGTLGHTTPEQIVRDADYAMYQAKSQGHARYEVFDSASHVHMAARMQKERDLREALDKGEFEVVYQPVYRLQSGEIEGFSAIPQWRQPGGKIALWEEFLPLAEETGLVISIGFFVLDQVTAQLKAWEKEVSGSSPIVSVHLSTKHFKYPQLIDRLAELLADAKISPGRLRLEIAESDVQQNLAYSAPILRQMVDLGLSVALENFGVGLASMNSFIRLPVDLVKMDSRLIASLPVSGRQEVILKTIFDLGRLLQVRMLAGDIERKEQLDALRKYGCDLVAGPLFSAAVSRDQAQILLRDGHWPEALNHA